MEIIRRLFSFRSHHTIAGTLCRLEAQAKAAILCLCGAFPAPLLWWSGPLSLPPRTTLLLIYRIQSHTHPKRRKFCLEHAGQKSVKDKLPEQRKGSKRAIECRLKVQTHVWDRIPRHSNPTRRTKHCQTERKSIKHQQKAADYLYPFSPFLAIPNAETSRRRPLHRNIFHDKLLAFCMTGK